MKKILLAFVLFLGSIQSFIWSQGASCAQMSPICTQVGANFSVDGTIFDATIDEPTNNYDCLLSAPSPNWFYFEISNAGPINMSLTAGSDIDYAIWGPFASLAAAQASCGNLMNVVSCSFSTTNMETPSIPNAQVGEVYVMLVTNFAQVTQSISLTQTSGTGATDCSIVSTTPCFMNYLGINISACQSGSVYQIDGQVVFSDNPGGNLIIEVTDGVNTYTQVVTGPFVNGDTLNTVISNLPADAGNYTYSCYFENDPACGMDIPFTAPASCNCVADVGTFTTTQNGSSTVPAMLCFGDTYDITSNGDNISAPDMNMAGTTYDPGIAYLVYSCPPTVGLDPLLYEPVGSDPCLVTVITGSTLNEINDGFWTTNFPGTFTDNTVYFVPITMYSNVDLTYSIFIPGIYNCYEMGPPFAITYLPEVTDVVVEDCPSGTVTVTMNGGQPELFGTQFSVVAGSLSPATASFVNTTCANGGSIVLGGLNGGDAYSFDITDGTGCNVTISGVLQGAGTATVSYPQNNYCQSATDPTPTTTGAASGTFNANPAGLSINATTGVIDVSASTPGTYTVIFVGSGAFCPPVGTTTVTISPIPVVSAGPDQTVCSGTFVTLNGSGASSYSWDNGVTNGVPFTPSATATYTVTGTDMNGCSNTDQVIVTVETSPTPTFTADITSGCAPLTVTFTNTSGGTNCVWSFSDGGQANGCASVTHTFVNPGCYDVSLATTSPSGCPGQNTMVNYICVSPDPIAAFLPTPNVLTELDPTSQMVNMSQNADVYAWNFGDGSLSNATSPSHTFPTGPGSYTIELIAISNAGCRDTAYATVVVQEETIFYVPNTFTPDNDEFNQTFQPVFSSGYDPFDFNMLIFNRWGEIVFETNNDKVGWDGTYHGEIVKDGTYTWKIEFKTSQNDARKIAVGHVNVLK